MAVVDGSRPGDRNLTINAAHLRDAGQCCARRADPSPAHDQHSDAVASEVVAGTLPGVIGGAIIRVQLLSGARAFTFVAAAVLFPIGLWLITGAKRIPRDRPKPSAPTGPVIWALALIVGTIGGVYRIGGGSLRAPLLMAAGYSAYEVAPATLTATSLTSIAGVLSYQVPQLAHGGSIAPDWILGASSAPADSLAATSARAFSAACPRPRFGACWAWSPA